MTPALQAPVYLHANALVLGEFGLLLRGPAGAGKSTLTLQLVADWRARGAFAALVGDDRITLEACCGRLIARPHPSIRGMIEARGLGVLRVDSEPACVLRAVVDLLAFNESPERCPDTDQSRTELSGVILPRMSENAARVGAATRIGSYIQNLATN
jgi:serine kinase of HPr protein (carbohydrate metabolism regulator)